MKPPFEITNEINTLVADISRILGQLEVTTLNVLSPKLRKKNRVRTIKSTLAIEGNTFTEEQITAILEHKSVLGSKREITEVKNAIELYDSIDDFESTRSTDFLKAHKELMKGLVTNAGNYRSKNVGILKGTEVKHLAPKPLLVPELMNNLFSWIKSEKEIHPLILSSIIHYEIEFIHPFEDGNGRIGHFWQAVALKEYDELFKYVPIESLIEKNQQKYYDSLEKSDKAGDSTTFIEFMLNITLTSLTELSEEISGVTITPDDRLYKAKGHFGTSTFTRKNYMELFKNISSATASRDLKNAAEKKILAKEGDKNKTSYRFI